MPDYPQFCFLDRLYRLLFDNSAFLRSGLFLHPLLWEQKNFPFSFFIYFLPYMCSRRNRPSHSFRPSKSRAAVCTSPKTRGAPFPYRRTAPVNRQAASRSLSLFWALRRRAVHGRLYGYPNLFQSPTHPALSSLFQTPPIFFRCFSRFPPPKTRFDSAFIIRYPRNINQSPPTIE